jgi:nucleoside-triphosphatase THEP1
MSIKIIVQGPQGSGKPGIVKVIHDTLAKLGAHDIEYYTTHMDLDMTDCEKEQVA